MNKITISHLPIEAINPYNNNPRQNENAIEPVMESIKDYGMTIPIIVDKDNVIISGHTRFLACKKLLEINPEALRNALFLSEGEDILIPVVKRDDLTEKQAKAFRIIDNKVAEIAQWDPLLLGEEILQLKSAFGDSLDFTRFGISQQEIDCLTAMVSSDCITEAMSNGDDEELPQADGVSIAYNNSVVKKVSSSTQIKVGPLVFFVPNEIFGEWENAIRKECDFDEDKMQDVLVKRLGFQPYIDKANALPNEDSEN